MYVLVEALGVVRIDRRTQQQTIYSPTVPILAPLPGQQGPFLINDLTFDKKGNLYSDLRVPTGWN